MNEKTSARLSFIVNVVYYAIVFALVYLAYKYLIGWTLPFILAFILVSVVHPIILRIRRRLHIEHQIINFVIMLLIYVMVALLLTLLVTQIVFLVSNQFSGLSDYFKETIQPALISVGETFSGFFNDLPEPWEALLEGLQGNIMQFLQSMLWEVSQWGVNAIPTLIDRIPTFVIALVFTIMLSFFIGMQYNQVTAFIHEALPPKINSFLFDLRHIMKDTVLRYLRATLTLMVITCVELAAGLMILGRAGAIPIALGIAIFDALPFFGTGAIMIPWVIIELLQSNFSFALGLLILYGVVTLVRNIIEPKIVSDKLGINPIVSLVSIYLGLRTMGVLGMIIMPILVQILLALQKAGNIRPFWKFTPKSGTQDEDGEPKEDKP